MGSTCQQLRWKNSLKFQSWPGVNIMKHLIKPFFKRARPYISAVIPRSTRLGEMTCVKALADFAPLDKRLEPRRSFFLVCKIKGLGDVISHAPPSLWFRDFYDCQNKTSKIWEQGEENILEKHTMSIKEKAKVRTQVPRFQAQGSTCIKGRSSESYLHYCVTHALQKQNPHTANVFHLPMTRSFSISPSVIAPSSQHLKYVFLIMDYWHDGML